MSGDDIEQWVGRRDLPPTLRKHVHAVVIALPAPVIEDLLHDPGFTIAAGDPGAVRLAAPGRDRPARSVLLRRSLITRSVAFIRWVIAHELAHAFLRNADAHPHEPAEADADKLAADWGFPRPSD
ncbi:MAG: hypothetical protein R3336_07555 [Phycisphaeraceae bacterium]|nr:hypothetical protein [Phycisphaeraceae bacterium]